MSAEKMYDPAIHACSRPDFNPLEHRCTQCEISIEYGKTMERIMAMPVEQRITQDLEVGLYAGKWNEAKRLAESKTEKDSFEYWMAARQLFLELGGRYVGQRV